ncbi:MAG: response regulator transcription factor [Myxococcota bacterium]|nr:response regulator transcription factor [Myxococcota bacterium]
MDQKPRILVVEDDLGVVRSLIQGLHKAGFEVSVAMDGRAGLEAALAADHDLLVLDLMLPERTGFEILEALQGRSSTPIIVLSARTELPARLRSFEGGAVDFVPKPFFMAELVARIKAHLSFVESAPHRILELAGMEVDLDAREVRAGGEPLGLTTHEFNVLAFLMEREGRALSREQIADSALPEAGDRVARTVDSHVSRVRKKLGPEASAHIKTVWGIGYRYVAEL